MPRLKFSYAQKKCVAATGMLMQRTEMVRPHARIGIAASGGVDSFALAKVMTIRKRIMPFPIELMILHVNPGFEPASHEPLVRWCEAEGLAAHIELTDFGPQAHSAANRKASPCFLCAWNRRKRLFTLCEQYGLTHLALGHNTDDLAETFFMNLIQNGRVDGLAAKEDFFGGELTLIRPALMVEKKYIRAAARQWELPVWENVCPSNGATKRTEMHELIEEISGRHKHAKNKIFNALRRHQIDLTLQKL